MIDIESTSYGFEIVSWYSGKSFAFQSDFCSSSLTAAKIIFFQSFIEFFLFFGVSGDPGVRIRPKMGTHTATHGHYETSIFKIGVKSCPGTIFGDQRTPVQLIKII